MKKMYICVLDNVPSHMVPVLVAHATARHIQQYTGHLTFEDWYENSFRKCVVSVKRKEFDKILELPNIMTSFENTVNEGTDSCITVIADTNDYKVLKFAKLWKP